MDGEKQKKKIEKRGHLSSCQNQGIAGSALGCAVAEDGAQA
jgi:hypothetical protein